MIRLRARAAGEMMKRPAADSEASMRKRFLLLAFVFVQAALLAAQTAQAPQAKVPATKPVASRPLAAAPSGFSST